MNKLLILILIILSPFSDSEWKLKKEKSGIEIYTRSVEGSSFSEFKGIVTILNSNLSDVLTVILDVNNYDRLFPDTENARILKQDGKYYDIHQIEVKAPWPVKARDAIYEQIAVVDSEGKHAIITLKPLPDFAEELKGFVRIQKGTGFWELTEDANHNVKVTYQFHGEPGGEVPSWLANSFVVTHPLKTLENLTNRVSRK
jgi:hypothetical protein